MRYRLRAAKGRGLGKAWVGLRFGGDRRIGGGGRVARESEGAVAIGLCNG